MNVAKLARAAKGLATPDELLELLAGLGVNAEMREMTEADASAIVRAASAPGSERKFVSLNGGQLLAMVVLPSQSQPALPNSHLTQQPALP